MIKKDFLLKISMGFQLHDPIVHWQNIKFRNCSQSVNFTTKRSNIHYSDMVQPFRNIKCRKE